LIVRAIVTRPRAQAGPLAAALREQGFEPVLCPLIEIEIIDDGPLDLAGYDWVVVTSANGAEQLAHRHVGDLPRVAAVGVATTEVFAAHAIAVDFVPEESSQAGLAAELPRPVGRVLFVGAEGAGEHLQSALGADTRAVYRIHELRPDETPTGDLVLLASASAARAWAALRLDLPAVSIGPSTTRAARDAGIAVVGETLTQNVRGLVDSAAAWRALSRS